MCPRCSSSETSSRSRRTSTGYCTFACRACGTVFNERTGTPFNDLQSWDGKTSCGPPILMMQAS